jgi:hypothetical protein
MEIFCQPNAGSKPGLHFCNGGGWDYKRRFCFLKRFYLSVSLSIIRLTFLCHMGRDCGIFWYAEVPLAL